MIVDQPIIIQPAIEGTAFNCRLYFYNYQINLEFWKFHLDSWARCGFLAGRIQRHIIWTIMSIVYDKIVRMILGCVFFFSQPGLADQAVSDKLAISSAIHDMAWKLQILVNVGAITSQKN